MLPTSRNHCLVILRNQANSNNSVIIIIIGQDHNMYFESNIDIILLERIRVYAQNYN